MRFGYDGDSLFVGPEQVGNVGHRIRKQVPGCAQPEGQGREEAQGERAVAAEDGAGEGCYEGL